MKKKKFVAAALDSEYETFVAYVMSLSSIPVINTDVHLSRRPWLAGLIPEKALMFPAITVLMASTVTTVMSVSNVRTVAMAITRGFD